jgi:hypothetical protein
MHIQESKIGLLWYVAYGSNMLRERLLAYIEGSDLNQFGGKHAGAKDARAPLREQPFILRHRLYFAGHSRRWSGPVAFLDCRPTETEVTLGRGYLLRWSQVESIIGQENGCSVAIGSLPAIGAGAELAVPGKYDVLLRLDDCDQVPAVTVTTSKPLTPGMPKDKYLRAMAQGLSQIGVPPGFTVDEYMDRLRIRGRAH